MNSYGMPNVAPNVFVKGGRFPSGGETYASPMNAGMAAFPIPIFDLPLKTSIIPRNSGGVPTFIRATTATLDDWEGIVRTALSGEARFNGARRVYNRIIAKSQDFSNANWQVFSGATKVGASTTLAPDGTNTAYELAFGATGGALAAASAVYQAAIAVNSGGTTVWSIYVRAKTGSTTIRLTVDTGPVTGTFDLAVTDTAWTRLSMPAPSSSASATCAIRNNTAGNSANVLVWGAQLEDVTGQSNTNPSEYVSVGVLSAPYHGANVDGVKYFDVTNSNTVVGGVVNPTGAASAAIANCTYWAEGARTNQCIRSEDFGAAAWTKAAVTATILAGTAPDGNVTANKIAEDATVGVEHFVEQSGVTGTDSTTASFFVWAKAVERSWLRLAVVQRDAATVIGVFFNLATGVVGGATGGSVGSIVAYPNGLYLCKVSAPVGTGASNPRIRMSLTPDGATLVYNGVAGSGILLWGAQFEDNVAFSSKYIPTLAAPVARNADQLSYPAAGNIVNAAGTSYAEVTLTSGTSGQMPVIVDDAFTSVALYHHNANTLAIFDGTNLVNSQAWTETTLQKLATSWGSTGIKTCKAGGAIASGVFDGAMNFTNVINIGSPIGAQALFGGIRNVRIWDRQLTDAQLTAFTAATFTAFS